MPDGDEKEAVKKRHLWTQEVVDEEPSENQLNQLDDDEDLDLIEQALADLDEDDSGKAESCRAACFMLQSPLTT